MKSTVSFRKTVAAAVAAGALALVAPAAAEASTFNENSSGCDSVTSSTTLYYKNPHGNFSLRVWVSNWGWLTSNKYDISMYDNSGSRLWSASGQTDRIYSIGGNVTRIELKRYSWQGADTCWRRL